MRINALEIWWQRQKEIDHLEEKGVGGRIILNSFIQR
jgi:hypothetical protein